MTDLVPHIPSAAGGDLVNPETGVIVTRESPDNDVIDLLAFLREGRARLDELDGELSSWLRERADVRRKWTLAGGRASVPSDRENVTWNRMDAITVLTTLEREGAITADDLEECAPLVRELHVTALNRLLDRALPDVVRRLHECQVRVPKSSRPVKLR